VANSFLKKEAAMSYEVYMLDNVSYGEFEWNYTLGVYDSYDEAIEEAREIVDVFLTYFYKSGMSDKELYQEYLTNGKTPLILSTAAEKELAQKTSDTNYAKTRAMEICFAAYAAGFSERMAS